MTKESMLIRNDVKAGLRFGRGIALTSVHHLYGASIYNTPWRAHIVAPAMQASYDKLRDKGFVVLAQARIIDELKTVPALNPHGG